MKNEIATPLGLAMTPWGVKIYNAFALVEWVERREPDDKEGHNEKWMLNYFFP